jgi:hypothetical protein
VDQPAMQATISVDKGMNVNEAEGENRRSDDGIGATTRRAVIERDHAFDKGGKVFCPCANVVGKGFACRSIAFPHKPTLRPQTQRNKPCIPNDDSLETLQFFAGELNLAGLGDGLTPSGDALSWRMLSFDCERCLAVSKQHERCGSGQ